MARSEASASVQGIAMKEPVDVGIVYPRGRRSAALVVEDHKDTIMSKIWTKSRDPLSSSHFFSKWNIALTKFIKNLAPDKLLTPTREDVLKWQSHLPAQASNSLWSLLGWKHKQFRDAIIFLSVAICDPSNTVKVKHNIEDHMDESQNFIDTYDLHCTDKMAKLAEGFLPYTVPLIATTLGGRPFIQWFNNEAVSVQQMRSILKHQHEHVPWLALEQPEMQSQYTVTSIGLNTFNNINPSLMGAEFVVLLAQALLKDHKMSTLESNDPLSMVINDNDLPSTSSNHLNFDVLSTGIPLEISLGNFPVAIPAMDAGNPVQTSSPNVAEVVATQLPAGS
ncbi:hypothetical protein P691DRAFT_791236 [Macrolepiota fuliginosa MF-IS2]|uniref:Uncharacterized protein n=1 Tax=Macrolepiota fuliginosa MF-IS2 TaxID=1400762 RepID=A0A9P5XGH2_9AGAR|nr:hypothetical protein P691DRAFT_791236 [Macrolepiota fuliginosa MF-IS2]